MKKQNKDQQVKKLINIYEDLFILCATNIPLDLLVLQDPSDQEKVLTTSLNDKIEKLKCDAIGLRDKIFTSEKDSFRLQKHNSKRREKSEGI